MNDTQSALKKNTTPSIDPRLPSLEEIDQAAQIVYRHVQPTPQYVWPLLCEATGVTIWTKHENHVPTGAFKVRGGLVYMHHLHQSHPHIKQVVSATRGNHGQSIALSASLYDIEATIVVPEGNSLEKNQAMKSLGANLLVRGHDFQAAREHAKYLSEQGYHLIPSLHKHLVMGVATYWLELLRAQPHLDALFVPIGMGSGMVAAIAAREALGLTMPIYGVVSSHALAYQKTYQQKQLVVSEVSTRIADGVACSTPDPLGAELAYDYLEDVIDVCDNQVEDAMRLYFSCTHQVAEGAGATPLAALLKLKSAFQGKQVGVPLTGGNVDRVQFANILSHVM